MSETRCTCDANPPHETFGACFRDKGVQYAQGAFPTRTGHVSTDQNKRWERRLDKYRQARADGIQPSSTKTAAIDAAVQASDAAGKAFDGSTGTFKE